jgi:peptide/nickel transport system substrate-binding protein
MFDMEQMITRLAFGAGLAVASAFGFVEGAFAQSEVVVGLQQEPTVLDPTADATASIDYIFSHNVFESLVSVTEAGESVPDLAKSWEVAEDGLTYTFTLHEGVKFHDGSDFDSADVTYSFARAMAEDSVNPSKDIFEPIESVEAPDPTTVVIKLKQRDAFFLFGMAQGDASIISEGTEEANKTAPIGTGPYKFDGWTRGDRLTLVKNPDHRDAADVAMEKITFRFIADPAASVAALLADELDAFPGMPAPEVLEQFEADPRFKVVNGTTEGEVILAMNNSQPPFNDIRVRRALSHALDRKAIIDGAMYGYATPIGSFLAPHHKSYVDLTGRYPLDLDAAKALLAEAGYADGLEVTMRLPPFPYARRSGEIIQSQLAKVGIDAKIENVEWGFWISDVYKQKAYDLTIIAHTSPNDMGNFARGPKYFYGYDNAEFNALWESIRTEPNPEKLDALLKDGQRFLAEDAVHGFLFQLPRLGVFKTGLSGYWTSAPVLFEPFKNWRWN